MRFVKRFLGIGLLSNYKKPINDFLSVKFFLLLSIHIPFQLLFSRFFSQ